MGGGKKIPFQCLEHKGCGYLFERSVSSRSRIFFTEWTGRNRPEENQACWSRFTLGPGTWESSLGLRAKRSAGRWRDRQPCVGAELETWVESYLTMLQLCNLRALLSKDGADSHLISKVVTNVKQDMKTSDITKYCTINNNNSIFLYSISCVQTLF